MALYQIIDKNTKQILFETQKEDIKNNVFQKMINEGRDVELKIKKTIIETNDKEINLILD